MINKPIVFLDIDGVARANSKPNEYKLCDKRVTLLNRAFELINCDVVISSNWRLAYPISFFNSVFSERVVGKTRDLAYKNYGEFTRWHEILDFMENHVGRPFHILDDQSHHFPSSVKQLILCDEIRGFSMEEFDALLVRHNNRKRY